MLFASFSYLLFLPMVVLFYWCLPPRFRLHMLLVASYFFYMSWIPAFIFLILGMTTFNWLWGSLIHSKSGNIKKWLFSIGIAANLLCLAYFKYAGFLVGSVNSLIEKTTGYVPGYSIDIILPLAISFFTFEFIHYLFDIYRGSKPIKCFVLFALFAAFFPTQIAGPIKRFQDFAAQMKEEKNLKLRYFDDGVPLIILGLAKKVLLADNLAILVNMGYKSPGDFSSPELWLFAYAFAFQIYFDFSGYTDIARGSAMLFGYKIPINFNLPYIASNISNFWHRWHISLSTWLRDYLYIPLGGSRDGKWITNRNLFLTMALGGLWHGASWNFVVWGVYHGIALIIHREFSKFLELFPNLSKYKGSKIYMFTAMIFTFHVVCIGWVFFRIQDIDTAFQVIKRMILFKSTLPLELTILQPHLPIIVPVTTIMVLLLVVFNIPVSQLNERRFFQSIPPISRAIFCASLLFLMVIFLPEYSEPFIYFQF